MALGSTFCQGTAGLWISHAVGSFQNYEQKFWPCHFFQSEFFHREFFHRSFWPRIFNTRVKAEGGRQDGFGINLLPGNGWALDFSCCGLFPKLRVLSWPYLATWLLGFPFWLDSLPKQELVGAVPQPVLRFRGESQLSVSHSVAFQGMQSTTRLVTAATLPNSCICTLL